MSMRTGGLAHDEVAHDGHADEYSGLIARDNDFVLYQNRVRYHPICIWEVDVENPPYLKYRVH